MNNKIYKIALLGAPINSTNLGCQALTYSLIYLLENIARNIDVVFYYSIFEAHPDIASINYFCNKIGVDISKIKCYPLQSVWRIRSYVKHFSENMEMFNEIKTCNFAIDMTAGDSFSDIYGNERFSYHTKLKLFIEKKGIPLILGPQTYGPFLYEKSTKYAGKVLKNATAIFARDLISAELIKNISGQKAIVTTDLAFDLPYRQAAKKNNEKLQLGINISGLLISEHIENTTTEFSLKTNYDQYLRSILQYVCNRSDFNVILIPHVEDDLAAIRKFEKEFNVQVSEMFKDPIEAKTYISSLDIFIGARMHSTIAAFTSGVLTIPTAYSRKFEGLFNLVEYNVLVDLMNYSTNESINKTKEYLENLEMMKECLQKSLVIKERMKKETSVLFTEVLDYIDGRK